MTQLPQSREVVPFGPNLKDLPIPNTIDGNVFGTHGLAAGRVRTHSAELNSMEMVPHSNLLTFRKHVEDSFLGVWKCLVFAAKKTHEVRAASDGRITGSYAVSYEVRRDQRIELDPVLGVNRVDKGLNDLFRIHERVARRRTVS